MIMRYPKLKPHGPADLRAMKACQTLSWESTTSSERTLVQYLHSFMQKPLILGWHSEDQKYGRTFFFLHLFSNEKGYELVWKTGLYCLKRLEVMLKHMNTVVSVWSYQARFSTPRGNGNFWRSKTDSDFFFLAVQLKWHPAKRLKNASLELLLRATVAVSAQFLALGHITYMPHRQEVQDYNMGSAKK